MFLSRWLVPRPRLAQGTPLVRGRNALERLVVVVGRQVDGLRRRLELGLVDGLAERVGGRVDDPGGEHAADQFVRPCRLDGVADGGLAGFVGFPDAEPVVVAVAPLGGGHFERDAVHLAGLAGFAAEDDFAVGGGAVADFDPAEGSADPLALLLEVVVFDVGAAAGTVEGLDDVIVELRHGWSCSSVWLVGFASSGHRQVTAPSGPYWRAGLSVRAAWATRVRSSASATVRAPSASPIGIVG